MIDKGVGIDFLERKEHLSEICNLLLAATKFPPKRMIAGSNSAR
jgi:hypothetical protein